MHPCASVVRRVVVFLFRSLAACHQSFAIKKLVHTRRCKAFEAACELAGSVSLAFEAGARLCAVSMTVVAPSPSCRDVAVSIMLVWRARVLLWPLQADTPTEDLGLALQLPILDIPPT